VHHGRVVKRTGDGIIIEFRSVVDAVRCAIEVQNGMVERNAGLPPERRMEFRVGSHLGDVVEESDGDLMGDGVNIAARLEGVAEPGGICLSEDAYRHVRDKVKEEFVDLGDKELKNIARPIRVYAVNMALGGLLSVQRAWTHERSKPQRLSILVLPFSMQDEIVARLANSFNAQLAAAEARRAERASNPDAMDLYFRGGACINKGINPQNLEGARCLYERALMLDPDNVEALVGVAAVHSMTVTSYLYRADRASRLALAIATVTKAISLAPEHALAPAVSPQSSPSTSRATRGLWARIRRAGCGQ
jgi:hypothetical protein